MIIKSLSFYSRNIWAEKTHSASTVNRLGTRTRMSPSNCYGPNHHSTKYPIGLWLGTYMTWWQVSKVIKRSQIRLTLHPSRPFPGLVDAYKRCSSQLRLRRSANRHWYSRVSKMIFQLKPEKKVLIIQLTLTILNLKGKNQQKIDHWEGSKHPSIHLSQNIPNNFFLFFEHFSAPTKTSSCCFDWFGKKIILYLRVKF